MTFLPSLLNQDLVRERSRMGRRRAPEERVVRPARGAVDPDRLPRTG